jgi:hypothetical protein
MNDARQWLIERPQEIRQVLEFAADCVDFAYEHGYHEHGVPIPDALLVLAREYDHTPSEKPAVLSGSPLDGGEK